MEPSRAFELMIRQCEAMRAPADIRSEALLILKYLKMQSLCDVDRRDDDRGIQRQWRQLEGRTKDLGLFAWARRNPPAWFAILDFVKCPDRRLDEGASAVPGKGMGVSADLLPNETSAPPPGVTPRTVRPDERDSWNVEEFFRALKLKVSSVELNDLDAKSLKPSLSYLLAEAQRARIQRDQKSIKETWLLVWPILNRLGFLDEYRSCLKLKEHLRFFVMDGFAAAAPPPRPKAKLKNVDLHRNLAKKGMG